MNLRQESAHSRRETHLWDERFSVTSGDITSCQRNRAFFHILGSDLNPHWDAAQFPIVVLETGSQFFTVIHLDANPYGLELKEDSICYYHYFAFFCIIFVNGHNDCLNRREFGRHDKALIVAMCHDDRANYACGKSPGRGIAILQCIVLIKELNIESLREILTKVM